MTIIKRLQYAAFIGMIATAAASHAADPHWTYDEQADWGALENTDPTAPIPALYPFAECGLGQKQSPVDISVPAAKASLNHLNPLYASVPLSVNNNGHTIKVNMPITANPNALWIGKESYQLLQFHFHAPSEHTLNGKTFPLELHFVHSTPSGKLAVLGVMIKAGAENPEFQKILDNAPSIAGNTNTPAGVTLDPNGLLSPSRKFYSYAGSLTTPPCTEGVDWSVARAPITVSSAQIAEFEALYINNARLPQALNGRIVDILP
jgi:carbonic anhydrase